MRYKFQNDRQDRVFASNNLGDEMNENTVEDIEILKCERSNLIEALQGLINLIDIKSPRLREMSGYAHAKNSLEKIS